MLFYPVNFASLCSVLFLHEAQNFCNSILRSTFFLFLVVK